MVTLDAILDEAKRDPSLRNTTVLNDDQFCTIRGPTNPIFRARLDAALAGSGDLFKVQQLNTDEGLEVIEPVRAGIHGGCWYLRNPTYRGETFPAGRVREAGPQIHRLFQRLDADQRLPNGHALVEMSLGR